MLKKVVTINDLSGAGRCSLTVAIPILSVLQVQAFPLPTAVLSNQTGYPEFYIDDFTEKMENFTTHWKKLGFEFDGIYTGYITSEKQVEIIEDFLRVFKKKDTLLLVDPIMGDDGEAYPNFNKSLCKKIKKLAMQADIIIPNLTECCILADFDYNELISNFKGKGFLSKIEEIGKSLIKGNLKQVVITGIRCKDLNNEEELYNIIIDKEEIHHVKISSAGGSYSGTGDIMASIICGCLVKGIALKKAVELAVGFIYTSIEDTAKEGTDRNDGINFEKFLYKLIEHNQ
ncbi:MAG: pyridoxamine kinase [Anaerotignaceae bacterium]